MLRVLSGDFQLPSLYVPGDLGTAAIRKKITTQSLSLSGGSLQETRGKRKLGGTAKPPHRYSVGSRRPVFFER